MNGKGFHIALEDHYARFAWTDLVEIKEECPECHNIMYSSQLMFQGYAVLCICECGCAKIYQRRLIPFDPDAAVTYTDEMGLGLQGDEEEGEHDE